MKILFYWPNSLDHAGGVEIHIATLVTALMNLGHAVSIIKNSKDLVNDTFDILHSHGDRVPPLFLRSCAKKWVHTLHGTSMGRLIACGEWWGVRAYRSAILESYASNQCDGLIVVSDAVLNESTKYLFNKNTNTAIIYNGADSLEEQNNKTNLNPVEGKNILLFLGRGSDLVKNVQRMMDALIMLKSRGIDFGLAVAPGQGFEAYQYPWIKNLGHLNRAQIYQYLKSCRLLLLPSLYEADPLVAWECMMLGKMAVITNHLKDHRYFKSYKGFLFTDPKSAEEIAEQILTALNAPKKIDPFIRTWQDVAKETDEFYKKVIRS